MTFVRPGVLLGMLLLVGCQQQYRLPNAVKVSGTVTRDGEPLHVEGRDVAIGWVAIEFCLIPPADQPDRQLVVTASAQVDDTGNYDLVQGIEPGKYLITIRQWDPYPQVDRLKGKFDLRNSKIVRQIDEDTKLDIDVSRAEG